MQALEPAVRARATATAGIDPHTEAILQRGIAQVMEGRTAIVIAHRLSTVRDADRIIVLDRGVIAEQGAHDELMRQNGIYHALSVAGFRDTPTGEAAEPSPAAEATR